MLLFMTFTAICLALGVAYLLVENDRLQGNVIHLQNTVAGFAAKIGRLNDNNAQLSRDLSAAEKEIFDWESGNTVHTTTDEVFIKAPVMDVQIFNCPPIKNPLLTVDEAAMVTGPLDLEIAAAIKPAKKPRKKSEKKTPAAPKTKKKPNV